jgi:hypothetical protein
MTTVRTLDEVNSILKHHNEVAINEDAPYLKDFECINDWQKAHNKYKKRHAKERERLTLMRNYLERVSPEGIAANYNRVNDQVNKLERVWREHEKTLGYLTSTVLAARKKQFYQETGLPKLKRQLKELSWLINQ